jgi:hypothetical protein
VWFPFAHGELVFTSELAWGDVRRRHEHLEQAKRAIATRLLRPPRYAVGPACSVRVPEKLERARQCPEQRGRGRRGRNRSPAAARRLLSGRPTEGSPHFFRGIREFRMSPVCSDAHEHAAGGTTGFGTTALCSGTSQTRACGAE